MTTELPCLFSQIVDITPVFPSPVSNTGVSHVFNKPSPLTLVKYVARAAMINGCTPILKVLNGRVKYRIGVLVFTRERAQLKASGSKILKFWMLEESNSEQCRFPCKILIY